MPPIAQSEPGDDGVAQFAQQRDLFHRRIAVANLADDLFTARRADAARRALAARFERAEVHRVLRQFGEVRGVVVDHETAVANHCADLCVFLVVERNIPLAFRQIRAERTAHLHRARRTAARRAAAVFMYQFAQAHTEREFDESALLDVARELEG